MHFVHKSDIKPILKSLFKLISTPINKILSKNALKLGFLEVLNQQKKSFIGMYYIADKLLVPHKLDVMNGHLFVQFEYYDPYSCNVIRTEYTANKKKYSLGNLYIDLEDIIQNDIEFYKGVGEGADIYMQMYYDVDNTQIAFTVKALSNYPHEKNPSMQANDVLFEGRLFLKLDKKLV